jgi:hypothetical protein
MSPEVQQYLQMYSSTQHYLKLCPGYCDFLGGLRWSDREDALVYPDGRYVAFNEAVAEFLEGFHTGGRTIAFSYILHWIDLLQNLRGLEHGEVRRLRELFYATGGNWRNAGALAAILTKSVPEVPQSPPLEMICRRLRDRAFPIRWYAARFHDSPEVPPLLPEAFETLVQHKIAAYSDEDLRAWFATGRGPLRQAGEILAQEPPQPRTLAGLLAALLQRPRLAGAETYVTQLVGALALPPRRLTPQELPMGGYADMVTRGQVEHLLPSQHALDDLEFLRRFAERELLFFRREEPPAQERQELAVLLDQGVRTWGDVRLVLAAAALALARQAHRRKVPFTLAATSNGGRPVELVAEEEEALGRLLEASDLSADPGLALETLLEQPSSALRDVILLTHPRNMREPDVLNAARRLGPRDRVFAVALDGHGQVEVSEVRHGAPVRLRQFHVDFVAARVIPPPPLPAAAAGQAWQGDVEPIPFPFRMGIDGNIVHFDFDHEGRHVLTVSNQGLLNLWNLDGARQECLPRPYHHGVLLREVEEILGVAGGFVLTKHVSDRYLLAHYDLRRRCCKVHVIPLRTQPLRRLYYARELHSVVVTEEKMATAFAVDLDTGEVYGRDTGGPASRAKQALLKVLSKDLLEHGRHLMVTGSSGVFNSARSEQPAVCLLESNSGTLQLDGRGVKWPPFTPQADGRPLLKGAWVTTGQLAGRTLALRVNRAGEVWALLLHGPAEALLREIPFRFNSHRINRFLLSADGQWIALLRTDQRIQVQAVDSTDHVLTTRAGGFSGESRLFVGDRYLLFCLGSGRQYWHLVDWHLGTLEHAYEHCPGGTVDRPERFSRPDIRASLSRARPYLAIHDGTPAALYFDAERFVAGSLMLMRAAPEGGMVLEVSARQPPPQMLGFGLDRYGQVAVLDAQGRLVAMFMAFRERLAAWLPDGTRFGTTLLSNGPAGKDAREKIGQALLAAERGQSP